MAMWRGRMHRLGAMALILAWLSAAPAAAAGLDMARDLAADARLMRERGVVMLVLFSQDGCPWCERARKEVLLPLQAAPGAERRVVLREIALDDDTPLVDFAGRRSSHRRFAAAAQARITPTLVVYGPDGERLGEPIVGFRLADFYAEYVERAIDEGLAQLRAPAGAALSPAQRRRTPP